MPLASVAKIYSKPGKLPLLIFINRLIEIDPESSTSVQWCWIKSQRQSFSWGRKGSQQACDPQKLFPNLGGFVKEFYSNSSRVGLLIILGYAQSLYSFNLVSGGLQINFSCPHDYQTVTFSLEWGLVHLPFSGAFSSINSPKVYPLRNMPCVYPLRWNQDSASRLQYCFLTVPPLFVHPFPSLISDCSNLPFGTQERSWKVESVPYKQVTGDAERLLCPGAP